MHEDPSTASGEWARYFGSARQKMPTGAHVEVTRDEARPGERRRFRKRFLLTDAADYRPWTAREAEVLARLAGVGRVARRAGYSATADHLTELQTFDAGLSVDQWAALRPGPSDAGQVAHVFEDPAGWWALAHHALAALQAIHERGLVHLDVKADNICIPFGSAAWPSPRPSEAMTLRFDELALIDFAFAVFSGEAPPQALPLLPQTEFEYQSPRLLDALEAGRRGDLRPTRALDWRCDLFSLAAMLWLYLPEPDDAGSASWTAENHAQATMLVRRLLDEHDAVLAPRLPHAELLELSASALAHDALTAALARGWTFTARGREDLDAAPAWSAPLTRVAAVIGVPPAETVPAPLAIDGAEVQRPEPVSLPAAHAGPMAAVDHEAVPPVEPRIERGEAAKSPAAAPVRWHEHERIRVPSANAGAPGASGAAEPDAEATAPARQAPPAQRRARSARRWTLGAAAGIGLALLAGVWMTTQRSDRPEGDRATASAAPAASERDLARGAAPAGADRGTPATTAATLPRAVPSDLTPSPTPAARSVAAAPPAATGVTAGPAVPPAAVSAEPAPRANEAQVAAILGLTDAVPGGGRRVTGDAVRRELAPDPKGAGGPPAAVDPAPDVGARPAEAAGGPQAAPGSLLTRQVAQMARWADTRLAAVLRLADAANDLPRQEQVRAAVAAVRIGPGRPPMTASANAREARRLNQAAHSAYWNRANLAEALRLELDAFAANPFDAEVAGNLAFYRMKQQPPQIEAARQLSLHSLALPDPRYPAGRIEDWINLAITNALLGREGEARRAWAISLALTKDVDRVRNAGIKAQAIYGERLRPSVAAMLERSRLARRTAPASTRTAALGGDRLRR